MPNLHQTTNYQHSLMYNYWKSVKSRLHDKMEPNVLYFPVDDQFPLLDMIFLNDKRKVRCADDICRGTSKGT